MSPAADNARPVAVDWLRFTLHNARRWLLRPCCDRVRATTPSIWQRRGILNLKKMFLCFSRLPLLLRPEFYVFMSSSTSFSSTVSTSAGKKVRVAWYGTVHHFWFPLDVMAIVFLECVRRILVLLLQQLESRRISDSLLAEPLFYILDICIVDYLHREVLLLGPGYLVRLQNAGMYCMQISKM
jgi:hypothetical protein